MSRTITALFDTRADAEAAKNRLEAASLDVGHVDLTDQASAGYSSDYGTTGSATASGTTGTTTGHQSFWSKLTSAFHPGDDAHVYEEGIRRGGTLLTATVHDDDADKAVDILDNANSVDIDGRAADWRASGWTGQPAGGTYGTTGSAEGAYDRDHAEAIPLVEEQLRVGKREVSRGGVRVRSYVVETPVSEQVSLRDEHVSVERRAVSDTTVPADAFRERTIEMTETAEEAVVGKEARVVEEVYLNKTAGEHTETVSDTVRHTEVEVEDIGDRERAGYAATDDATDHASLGDRIAGNAKEAAGKVSGNDDLTRRGEAQAGKTGY